MKRDRRMEVRREQDRSGEREDGSGEREDGSGEREDGSEELRIDVKKKGCIINIFYHPQSIHTAIPASPLPLSPCPYTCLPLVGECRVDREATLDHRKGIHLELRV